MNPDDLLRSLDRPTPPPDLPPVLEALWHDARGDWDAAHEVVQSMASRAAAHVHAYLHRKEGDLPNADYWYRRAGVGRPDVGLAEEWRDLVVRLVDETSTGR